MPSNKELEKKAHNLAKKLGIKVDTKDLTNDRLGSLVSDLHAKVNDAKNETQADIAVAKKEIKAASKKKEKKPDFTVAKGKSVTTKHRRDIRSEFKEVTEGDFPNGMKDLEALVDKGVVDHNR